MQSRLLSTYAQLPFSLAHAEGMYVFDTTGRRYLDMYGGHAVALLGHSPSAVLDAIREQGEKLFFYSTIAPMELREKVAEQLCRFVGPVCNKVFFCNSGAEANENALKLAIAKTGRSKLVALKGSFHGRTLLASLVTDTPAWHTPFKAWQGGVEFLAPNDFNSLHLIDTSTAAVIAEPIQSMAGVVELQQDYLQALRKRCDEVGAFLIFDEVQTGMGRTGVPYVASGAVAPDMVSSAKGLAAGFPVGVLMVNERIAGLVKGGDLGSTFGANPLAMAAVSATLAEVERRELVKHVAQLDTEIKPLLKAAAASEIRGRGCLLGIKTAKPAKEVCNKLLELGVITGSSNDPQVLRLMPPIIAESQHFEQFALALKEVLGNG